MNHQTVKPSVDRTKVLSIAGLFAGSVSIILAGGAFAVYSAVNGIIIPVMDFQIHGSVWGLIILFLGVRYLFSVRKLKAEVFRSSSKFSWSNFRSEKISRRQRRSTGK